MKWLLRPRWPGASRRGGRPQGADAGLRLVDIHLHILPGLDDGPEDWAGALEVARAAAEAGTGLVVATPHYVPGRPGSPPAGRVAALVDELKRRLDEAGVELAVEPGAEVCPTPELPARLRSGEVPLLGQAGSVRYLLVDTPLDLLPPNFERLLFEIRLAGVIPVLAHPERCRTLAGDPARVGAYIRQGALVQVTAGSLLGEFGPQAFRGGWRLLEEGWVQAVASDGHGVHHRSPARLAAAFEAVRRRLGDPAARRLCCDNPQAMALGRALPS